MKAVNVASVRCETVAFPLKEQDLTMVFHIIFTENLHYGSYLGHKYCQNTETIISSHSLSTDVYFSSSVLII
jgi:hypothetical protein